MNQDMATIVLCPSKFNALEQGSLNHKIKSTNGGKKTFKFTFNNITCTKVNNVNNINTHV
jgi:hypothetical protein